MVERKKGKSVFLWIAGILIVLIVGGVAGWHYLKKDLRSGNSKAKPFIKKEMKTVVAKVSDNLYKVDYADFKLNMNSGFASFSNLKISPDTSIYHKLVSENRVPDNILSLTASKIVVQNFGFRKNGDRKVLHIIKMEIDNPTIHITNQLRSYNDTARQTSLMKQLLGNILKKSVENLGEMVIDQIIMKNTSFTYVNNNDETSRSTSLRKLDITLSNISTTNVTGKDSGSGKLSSLTIGHQRILTGDGLYYLDFNNMKVLPQVNSIALGSFTLTPTISKAAFYKIVKAGKANYRYQVRYTGLTMNDVDFERLFKKQQIFIGSVTAADSWSEFYTNFNWPLRTPPNRTNKYPHDLLQRLAFDVTIKKMIVKHGTIVYKIVARKSQKQALLTINDLSSEITNITNNSAEKRADKYATARTRLKIMNAGWLQSKMQLNLVDKNYPFTINSTLGSMDGTAFNPLAEPLGMMRINSLNSQKMEMVLHGDEYAAKGNIDYYYKDMKVQLLKKDSDNDTLKSRKVISFFTNLALPNDNPKKNGKFRKGPINVVRSPQESFFGFIWRGMLDGLSSATSGMDQNKDKPGNTAIEMGKIFAGPKNGPEEKSAGEDNRSLNSKKSKNRKSH